MDGDKTVNEKDIITVKTVNEKDIITVCPIVMPISKETIGFFVGGKMVSII